MTLPPWHSDKREEQEALLRWAVDALDDFDPRDLGERLAAMNSPHNVRRTRELFDRPLFERLRADLPHLTWEAFCAARYGPKVSPPPGKRGRKGSGKVAAAKADNERLTILFERHYGRTKREAHPSRMAILETRHQLTTDEYLTVENYITKVRPL